MDIVDQQIPLTASEMDEIKRRALHLLRLHGNQDPDAYANWRKYSTIYQNHPLMLVNDDYRMSVRWARPVDRLGIECYSVAYERLNESGHTNVIPDDCRLALAYMRRLMLLDDLADV